MTGKELKKSNPNGKFSAFTTIQGFHHCQPSNIWNLNMTVLHFFETSINVVSYAFLFSETSPTLHLGYDKIIRTKFSSSFFGKLRPEYCTSCLSLLKAEYTAEW